MLKKSLYTVTVFSVALFLYSFTVQERFPVLSGAYLGQKAPSEMAEIFMDGIISIIDEPEMCAAFTMDGKEFYFNRLHNGKMSIFCTHESNGIWTRPAPLPFSGKYTDRDFTISPDGNTIFFGSNRPAKPGGNMLSRLDIYYINRLSGIKWSDPENIGSVINTDKSENYPSVSTNGNLYFFSERIDGHGGCDIYVSRFIDDQYQKPEVLDLSVNSGKHDWDSYVAQDESYIIFSSKDRDDTIGGQDLYISFRVESGKWTKAVNMGPKVNSTSGEICPSVTLDGKYLFFTSRRRGDADIFWIDAKIIEEIKSHIERRKGK